MGLHEMSKRNAKSNFIVLLGRMGPKSRLEPIYVLILAATRRKNANRHENWFAKVGE